MLKEQQTELSTISLYEEYLNCGGCLPQEDFQVIQDVLSIEEVVAPKTIRTNELEHIASYCDITPTPQEKLIYDILCKKMVYEQKSFPQNIKPVTTISDQFLIREIFLVTDKTGEKYRIVTERCLNYDRYKQSTISSDDEDV